jgi:hypothetical protein
MPVEKMQVANNISCLSTPCIHLSKLLVLLAHCMRFCRGSIALEHDAEDRNSRRHRESRQHRVLVLQATETRVFQARLRGLVCVQSNTVIGGRSLESRGTLTCSDEACDHECY